jgi:hypothetical protein
VFRGFNIYFARTTDGVAFSSPLRITSYTVAIPRAAANSLVYLPNGDVYTTWSESVGDFVNEIRDVLYSVSTDGGRTFSAPTKLLRVLGVVGDVFQVGKTLELVTQYKKNDHTLAATRLYRSGNGGKSYSGGARIARPASYNHLHENSVGTNAAGVVAIGWAENASRLATNNGIYIVVSRDGGKHFGSPTLVMPGLFLDPPSVVVDSQGRIGVAFSAPDASLESSEVLFVRVAS